MVLPLPGATVPEVVSQLVWRVLGPLKGRAKSVLDWAGLGPAPPAPLREKLEPGTASVARRWGGASNEWQLWAAGFP